MQRFTLLLLIVFLTPHPVEGYETDQFHNRLEDIQDSTQILDRQVNQAIEEIAHDWEGSRDPKKFAIEVFHSVGGYHWVDKIERWAMESEEVDRLSTPKRESIYAGHPIWATRVIGLFGVGPTIKLNGQLIGSDKLGHFFSQGKKFFLRYLQSRDEALAAEHSAYTERAIFGQLTTGVYSNADLVANYEGLLFYRSLFEDDIIKSKPAIVVWKDDGWHIQRNFTFADHVNAYWDEALNINHFDGLLYPHMKERLSGFCDDYQDSPGSYQIDDEEPLIARYEHLQLRDTSELRLDSLCEPETEETGITPELIRAQ